MSTWNRLKTASGRALAAALLMLGASGAWAQANLQVSSFTYNTPVLNGSTQTFTVVAKNIGVTDATNARLRVFLPSNFTFSTAPAGCAFAEVPHTFGGTNNPAPAAPAYNAPLFAYAGLRMMSCSYATVVASSTTTLNFDGVASSSAPPEVANMVADFYSDTAEPPAGDGVDNYLEKQITVNSGSDLALQATPIVVVKGVTTLIPPTTGAVTSAGSALTATFKTKNNGPDPATTAQVQVTLPVTSDFVSVVVPTGTPWACTNASNTVTCIYGGSAVAAGVNFADIVINGTIASNLTGAVSFGVSIPTGVPQNATDPITTNNGPVNATLNILAVAELAATKSLLAYGVATTAVAFGKPATYRIGITNNGPSNVAANLATLTDTIGTGWTIGALPTGCNATGQTVTCKNTATLNSNSSVSFDIPVTAPASGTCPDNTATVALDATMIDTNASNDTSPNVTCNWVSPAADLAAIKRLLISNADVTSVALGQSAVFRIGISNAASQPVVPANGAQVVDTFAADWTIGAMPSGCSKTGQTVTCTNAAALAAGQSVTFDIPVTAPALGADSTNNATVSLLPAADGLTDGNNGNDTASVIYTFGIPQVDVQPFKEFWFNSVVVSSVGTGQPTTLFRIGITNATGNPLPVPALGAKVVDDIPAGWVIGTLPTPDCTAVGQQVTCVNQAAIAVGATKTFDIPVTPSSVNSCTGGFNSATVTLTAAGMIDPNTGAADTTQVACAAATPNADIYVSNKAKVRTAGTGTLLGDTEQITNTITVKNRNTSNAFATGTITVTDTLGPNEIFVSGGGAGTDGVWGACSSTTLVAGSGTVTCTITKTGNGYAPDETLPLLSIITKADLTTGTANATTGLFTLTNKACAGRAADAAYTLDGTGGTGSDCFSKDINASKTVASGVTLAKVATTAGGVTATLESSESAITYTITVTAAGFTGGSFIPTLKISDPIPLTLYGTFASLGGASTGVTASVVPAIPPQTGESCTVSGATVDCTLKNVSAAATRSITVTVTRPVYSGINKTNTVTASSPDSFITGSPSATAMVNVDPQTDITVSKSANPTTSPTGAVVRFTNSISIKGPDGAVNLKMLDAFDPTRFDYVAGSAVITPNPNSKTCTVKTMNESTGDTVYDGVTGLQCDLGDINPDTIGTTKTIVVVYDATPKYPYLDPFNATYTNKVRVKTDTVESNYSNNTATATVSVSAPALDLSVTKTDVLDPVEWDDSVTPKALITYLIKAISSSSSNSTAHNVKVIDVPLPATGFTMTYASSSVNAGSTYSPVGGVTCTPDAASPAVTSYVTCRFADLPANKQVWLNMVFHLEKLAGSPARATSFNNVAKICADEGGPTADSQATDTVASLCGFAAAANYDATPADNRITERTTILPLTDLHAFYKKPVAAGTTTEITSIQLNQEFDYLVKVRNKGPVDAFLATVTDALPAGFRRTATAITVTPGAGVTLPVNDSTCTSSIATGAAGVETVTCTIGSLPADASADGSEDATKAWVIRIPVKADPTVFVAAAQPYNTNIPNTVSIVPAQDPLDPTRPLSKDRVPGNNTATGNILVPVKAQISGRVFESITLSAAPTGAEPGISGVTITLTGLDDTGAACTAGMPGISTHLACGVTRTTTTAVTTGAYSFDNLPPGSYRVEETQPASHFDGRQFVGARTVATGAAGTASTGFVATGGKSSITNIFLANNEVGTNYNFEEYKPIAISGLVFEDRDRSTVAKAGIPDALNATEPRIVGVKVRISGTDYAGNALGGVTGYLEATTAGTGATNYSFTALPPPNATGYTLTEIQPTAYVNGPSDPPTTGVSAPTLANLSGSAAIGAIGSYSRPDSTSNSTYTGIQIALNQVGTNYNFPEVRRPNLSGRVYVDVNVNNTYNAGDTNISGATVVLRNAADLTNSIATTTTAGDGTYSFTNLNPLITYVLEEPLPTSPTSLGNRATAVNVGTVNAALTGTAAANTPTADTDRITGIDLSSGFDGINYNFGEDKLVTISGAVFLDRSRNGTTDVGEPGIESVILTLVAGSSTCATPLTPYAHTGLTNPVTTAATTGAYSFSPVPAGAAYTICETQPAGYADGPVKPMPSGSVGGDTKITIATLSASGSTANNFPEILGDISGVVFADFGSGTLANNNNGIQNGSEPGIGSATASAGVPVVLSGTSSAGPAFTAITVYTDGTGAYKFTDIYPGTYTLTQGTIPVALGAYNDALNIAGTVSAGGTVGTAGGLGSNTITSLVMAAGSQSPLNNFAKMPQVALDGIVFIDYNNNGIKDGSDHGISVQTINLTGTAVSGTPVTRTTTTAADGSYSFTALPLGTYAVTQPAQPPGTNNGSTIAGSTGGTVTAVGTTPSAITAIVLNGASTLSSGNNFAEISNVQPDLSIAKTHTPANFAAGGSTGIYTITPGNIGTGPTTGTVTVVDTLPAGITVAAAATGTGWTCSGAVGANIVTCTSTTVIAAGGTGNLISLRVAVATGLETQTLTNTAVVLGGGEPVGLDGNNTATDPVTIAAAAAVQGHVWLDRSHTRKFLDAASVAQSGWTVELLLNGTLVTSTTTDSLGAYAFTKLAPSAGYQIRFRHPGTGLIWGNAVPNEDIAAKPFTSGTTHLINNPAGAVTTDGTLSSLTLVAGTTTIEQSLPLDPAGVVYDATSRQPVANAVVTITCPACVGFNPATHLVGGTAAVTTGTDGLYQFLLTPTAPTGTYTLTVTTYPPGYVNTPSTLIPVCTNTLTVGAAPNPALIQTSNTAPVSATTAHVPATCPATTAALAPAPGNQGTTQYFSSFALTPGTSGNVVNNHIPLDPTVAPPAVLVPVVSKTFSPATISAGGTSTLTITLGNSNAWAINLTADLTDTLPANVTVAPTSTVGGSCPGSKTAAAGGSTVTYTAGAAILSGGCTITVTVTSSVTGSYLNTIAAGDLKTTAGNNPAPATAPLTVTDLPTLSKSFAPATIKPSETSTLTISLGNTTAAALTLTAALTDTLPANVTVANTPAIGGTCPGGATAASGGSTVVYPATALIPVGGCTITVNVTSTVPGAYVNTIPAGALQTTGGNNPTPATAPLTVTPPPGPSVSKSFAPTTIKSGETSTLTISLGNTTAAVLTLTAALTDTLPGNVTVAATPAIGGTCTGSKTAAAGGSSISYALGASIPVGGCTIMVNVTSTVPGAYVNTIPTGALQTSGGSNPTPATSPLTVTAPPGPSVSKSFAPATIKSGETSTLTISLGNTTAAALTLTAALTDTLPANVTVATTPAVGGTCPGGATAASGGSTVVYPATAVIPVGGCTITVNVTSKVAGAYVNTIPAGALQTNGGSNPTPATAPLTVTPAVSSLLVQKTLYQGKNGGAGCPGVSELVIVDVTRTPKDITWCFAVTNTSSTPLANPVFDDPGLNITAASGQARMQLKAGVLPLQPGATATWYVEEQRSASLLNKVTVTMTPTDGSPPVSGDSTGATIFAYVFDPPFGLKTGLLDGLIKVRWSMVWINDNIITAKDVTVGDQPPVGMTFGGNLVCTPQGSTVVKSCTFEAASVAFPRGRVVVNADMGPDLGATDAASAANELDISFDATINDPATPRTFENRGEATWTPPDGTPPLVAVTNAPTTGGGPTAVPFVPTPVIPQPPTLYKSFAPAVIKPGEVSVLTIIIGNTTGLPLMLTSALIDTLPANVLVANPPALGGTCTGSKTAVAGGSVISYDFGGQIQVDGCFITVNVTSSLPGTYINTLPTGALQTSGGSNPTPATAPLTVLTAPSISKSFAPTTIKPGETSVLTISLVNPTADALTLTAALTDTLPANVKVAATPAIGGTCPGAKTAAAGGSSISYALGASVPAGSCTITVNVTSTVPGAYLNTIPAGGLQTTGGSNPFPVTAPLTVTGAPSVTKAFAPTTIKPGETSVLTITLVNPMTDALTLTAALTDTLPANVKVAATPAIGGTCTGAKTATAGGSSVSYASGASVPAGSCTITVNVTSTVPGAYLNTIPAGGLQTTIGINPDPATAPLTVAAVPSVTKAFAPTAIKPGETSVLTITLVNPTADALTLTAALTDTLPTNVKVAATPAIGGTCTGSKTATAGGNSISYASGASVPAGSCTITVNVTSTVPGAYLNTIPAGALQTPIGNNPTPATATLTVDPTGGLLVNKTLYQGKDAGAGCPGVKELVIVDVARKPKDITWCFAVTNMGKSSLANPVFDDPGLNISATVGQARLQLKSGVLPLAPNATAIWYVEDVRNESLLNTVKVTMTPTDGAPPVSGDSTGITTFAFVFDPPFGIKTGLMNGLTKVRWNMVWINDNVITARDVTIGDQIPVGMTYGGGLLCSPQGSTVVKSCVFEAASAGFPRGRVVVVADIGPDLRARDAANAQNELVISFDATIDDPATPRTFENQGNASWNPDGTPLTAITHAPAGGPTVVPFVPAGQVANVPTLSEWGMIILSGLLGLMAMLHFRRQQIRR